MDLMMIETTAPGTHLDRILARHAKAARRNRWKLSLLVLAALTLPLLLV